MRKRSLAILALILTVAAWPARASGGDEAALKARLRDAWAGWASLDTSRPAPFYAKDPGLVFYDLAPLQYTGWKEYAAGVQKNFFDQASSMTFAFKDEPAVTRRGKVAWTMVTVHLSLAMKNGQKLELDARHTAVWEKRGGQWLIVHEHTSAPLPG